MMNRKDDARQLLFRALVGETPLPTNAELAEAQASLATDEAAQAALDELLGVITRSDRTPPSHWYDQLHAYAAAQLHGQGDAAEFAALRRLLDADVTLAEEYALLYETLRAEAAGLLAPPAGIPPADLSFLPLPAHSAPAEFTPPSWLAQRRHALGKSLAALARLFQQRDRFPQVATVVALTIIFVIGVWLTEFSPRRSTIADNPATLPTATAVSHIDPRMPEEPLRQWKDDANNQVILVEKPALVACTEGVSNPVTRRGCPM